MVIADAWEAYRHAQIWSVYGKQAASYWCERLLRLEWGGALEVRRGAAPPNF